MPSETAPPATLRYRLQQLSFLVCSRIFVAVYRRFPVFGRLRTSLAVVWRQGRLLMIERSDRLGCAFPGGVSMPWESDEVSMRRELREETGLESRADRLLFRYHDDSRIPVAISVYWVEARGEPRSSWEGVALWLAPAEAEARIFSLHAVALARVQSEGLLQISRDPGNHSGVN